MASSRRGTSAGRFRFWVLLLVLAVGAYFLRGWWLPPIGEFLIRTDPPQKAEVIVLLAGDASGFRITKAAELAQQGFAPKVLVSGPSGFFDGYECDYAIAYAVRRGFPASLFECVPHSARSTKAEAAVFVPLLRKMGVKHYILFSSDFHTRRAGKLFRAEGPELKVTVIGAVHPQLNMSTWWTERETVKAVWAEMQKTLTGPLGL